MKYVTVKLTEDQALHVIHSLWLDIDASQNIDRPDNAFIVRIANKFAKALAQAKTV